MWTSSAGQINCPRLGGMVRKQVRERKRDEADGSEEVNLLQDLGKHNKKRDVHSKLD